MKLANTTIRTEGNDTIVKVYDTDVIRFNATHITVNHGGWITPFTASCINAMAQTYGLNFHVNITGGKRVRHSNNLLHKLPNPTGARMELTYHGGTVTVDDGGFTFERVSPLPTSALEEAAQTDR